MSLVSTLSLFLFTATFAILVQSGSSVQAVSSKLTNVSLSCTANQTPCAMGCCPFVEGVCCADGYECCQHGQTCVPFVGLCIGLVKNSKEALGLSLDSTWATPVKNLVTGCPPYYTDCSEGKCCPLPSAVCCEDGKLCCPAGYACDLPNKQCVWDSINSTKYFAAALAKFVPATKSIKKSPYKSCPESNKICSSYSSCCILDSGDWGCCPKPSLKNFKMDRNIVAPDENVDMHIKADKLSCVPMGGNCDDITSDCCDSSAECLCNQLGVFCRCMHCSPAEGK